MMMRVRPFMCGTCPAYTAVRGQGWLEEEREREMGGDRKRGLINTIYVNR